METCWCGPIFRKSANFSLPNCEVDRGVEEQTYVSLHPILSSSSSIHINHILTSPKRQALLFFLSFNCPLLLSEMAESNYCPMGRSWHRQILSISQNLQVTVNRMSFFVWCDKQSRLVTLMDVIKIILLTRKIYIYIYLFFYLIKYLNHAPTNFKICKVIKSLI